MRDIIITTYFTGIEDPQRKQKWHMAEVFDRIKTLSESCEKFGIELVVLCDFTLETPHYARFIRVETSVNPYFQRWISIADYLEHREDIGFIFHLDATDTEVLKNPFENLSENILYIGSEPSQVNNKWIRNKHTSDFIPFLIAKYGHMRLLNAGIVGGEANVLYSFCTEIERIFVESGNDYADIPAINWHVYESGTVFETGPNIHTVFKQNETNNKTALFRHK